MSDVNLRATIGHNMPPEPIDLDLVLNPDLLRDQLELDYQSRLVRRDELLAGADTFFAQFPVIENEAQQARATDFAKQMKDEVTALEKLREKEGGKFYRAHKSVTAFFNAGIIDRLKKSTQSIEAKMTVFARAKAARLKAEADALAKQRAAEADALAAEANRTMRPSQIEAAITADAAATVAQKAADQKPSDFGRTYGNTGAVASLRPSMKFRVVEIALVPPEFLEVVAARVNAQIADGVREIPGLEIYDDAKVSVR